MHTWLFHVINFQQIPKPAVLGERWFHFIQPPLMCPRDRSINNSAWIRLHLLQLGEQTQLRCPVWLRGALLQPWWRWKEVGSEEQLFLIAIIVNINRNQGWYLSKVTTYWKNLKHYFSTLGEKKTSESLIELVFRSDFNGQFNIESYGQYEFVSADLRAHDGFLAVWRRL